jgi:Ca2+-binding RTX toxin-like protein
VPYAAFQAGHGPWAQGSEIRIVYDTYSGALYHDPDGLGGAEAVQFATLQTAGVAPALSASDLFVA